MFLRVLVYKLYYNSYHISLLFLFRSVCRRVVMLSPCFGKSTACCYLLGSVFQPRTTMMIGQSHFFICRHQYWLLCHRITFVWTLSEMMLPETNNQFPIFRDSPRHSITHLLRIAIDWVLVDCQLSQITSSTSTMNDVIVVPVVLFYSILGHF